MAAQRIKPLAMDPVTLPWLKPMPLQVAPGVVEGFDLNALTAGL